ncbi:MAG TPA: hypothetical protein VFM57_18030 [Thermoleophilaceae bacterium]|nr:hypothetical protein [Thermoleophilaceae bacterium]
MDLGASGHTLEQIDAWLTGLLTGASLPVALAIACLLGLRHATDPDHMVAVTALVAGDRSGRHDAMRLGAWWGVGHAATLLSAGIPLTLLESQPPAWLERGAETAIGLVMVLLAARVLVRWLRGAYRMRPVPDDAPTRERPHVRSPREALAIGVLHGVAGTGAVVVLLIAALPSPAEATMALLLFAPMTVLSMVLCTGGFAWSFTRPAVAPFANAVLIPALGAFGLFFGAWYAGLL